MGSNKLKELEADIEALIRHCERLKESNQHLRDRQAELLAERDQLIAKQEKIKTKLNNIVKRVKEMDAS